MAEQTHGQGMAEVKQAKGFGGRNIMSGHVTVGGVTV